MREGVARCSDAWHARACWGWGTPQMSRDGSRPPGEGWHIEATLLRKSRRRNIGAATSPLFASACSADAWSAQARFRDDADGLPGIVSSYLASG